MEQDLNDQVTEQVKENATRAREEENEAIRSNVSSGGTTVGP